MKLNESGRKERKTMKKVEGDTRTSRGMRNKKNYVHNELSQLISIEIFKFLIIFANL